MNRTTNDYDDDDDVEALLARRRRKRSRSHGMLWAGLVAGAAVLIAGAVAIAVLAKNKPAGGGGQAGGAAPPPRNMLGGIDYDRMTYREMYEHLQSRGLTLRFIKHRGSIYFATPEAQGDLFVAEVAQDRSPARQWPDHSVEVFKKGSAEDARQAAGSVTSGTFNFGVWLFYGDERLLTRIRSALSR